MCRSNSVISVDLIFHSLHMVRTSNVSAKEQTEVNSRGKINSFFLSLSEKKDFSSSLFFWKKKLNLCNLGSALEMIDPIVVRLFLLLGLDTMSSSLVPCCRLVSMLFLINL